MKLFEFELFKLLKSPAIFCFLAVCLIINTAVVLNTSRREEIEYMNRITEITGTVYNSEYAEKLKTIPAPNKNEYNYSEEWIYEAIIAAADKSIDSFDMADNIEKLISDKKLPISETAIKLLEKKYETLSPELEAKAERGDYNSVYFGELTYSVHETVFGIVGRLLSAEASVFFILIMLWALGYVHMTGTSQVICATKTGRKISIYKIATALLIGSVFFMILYIITYGLEFSINDFSLVWRQNVSSRNNMVYDKFLGNIPFITWSSMSIGYYFFSFVGVSFLNAALMGLFAVPFGLMIRNTYFGFCAIAGIIFLNGIIYTAGLTMETVPFLWHLLMITPLMQILHSTLWFSAGDTAMLLPHFEIFYPLICMLPVAAAVITGVKRFKRKEIV